MKKLIILIAAFGLVSAHAHQITGTPVLKGSLKTKLNVNSISTTCKVKVADVKNLLEEDSFGNPAYHLDLEVSLSGNDFNRGLSISFDRKFRMTNLFASNAGTIVKDFEYYSAEGAILTIKPDGRLRTVQFPFQLQTITCSF